MRGRKLISGNTRLIHLNYTHLGFNQVNFGEFGFISQIIFQLNHIKYIVKGIHDGVLLEKFYGEQLTEEEINGLINSEMQRHKAFIEKKIEASRKK